MSLSDEELFKIIDERERGELRRWKAWAADPDAEPIRDGWGFVHEALPQVRTYNAGGIFPFQADGLVGDYGFYLRERGGYPSLSLIADSLPFSSGEVVYYASLPEDVTVSRDNFVEIFEKLYAHLEKRAPLWSVKVIVDGEERSYPSRGWSEEEAIENMENFFERQKNETVDDLIEYFSIFGKSQEETERRARNLFDYYQNLNVEIVSAVFQPTIEGTDLEDLKKLPEFDEVRVDLRKKN